jgi:hypothetical protein
MIMGRGAIILYLLNKVLRRWPSDCYPKVMKAGAIGFCQPRDNNHERSNAVPHDCSIGIEPIRGLGDKRARIR